MATERSAGAGGKFRKKPSRSTHSTPYDRPTSALRPTAQLRQNNINNNNGWLSKLVDPASRLITAGANKLFSSVFRKRLLPPPQHPPPDDTMEKGDVQPEITTQGAPSGTKEPVVCRGDDSRVSDNGGVAELEGILKQKTFTRSEIDHLTSLLLSRTAEKSVETQTASLEPKSLGEMAVHSRCETTPSNLPALENGAGHVLPAAISTPDVRSKAVEDAVASPAELAKAYMGSRPTRASPSVAAMQNEMQREDLSQYNPFVKQKTPTMSVIQKPANDIGASANGFMTPRFRGRSAIYSMARTPYSRPEPTEVYKAAETASDAHGAPSSAHNATETQQFSGSKRQVLKRRSSVLESDIGFVGPIRRIRQKPNLLNHKTLTLPASGGSYVKHGYGDLADVNEVPSSSGRSSNYYPSSKALANNGMASTSNGYVPSQSIEMAQKIFQQLDKFTPKGKSPENNVDIAEGSSSGKMTSDTRDGLAHRSMNTVYSSKVLQTVQDIKKENGLSGSISAHDHTSKISPRVEEGCAKKFVMPPVDDGEKAGSLNMVLDHLNPQPSFDHQQKKRAFQMSAHEDYLELDDDVQTSGIASTPVIKGVESHELAKDTAALSGTPPQNASISGRGSTVSEPKPSALLFGTSEEEALPDGSAAAQKVSGFAFPAVPSISSATHTSTQAGSSYAKSTAETVKVAEQSENTNVVPAFSAKMAPFTFSSSLFTVEPAAANDIKQELPSSATEAAAKADGPGKFDKKSTLLFGNASKKMADGPNEASSAKGFFSFGLPSNGATVSNSLSNTVSVTMGVSSPVQISSSTNYPSPVPVSVTSPSLFSFSNGNAISFSSSAAPAGTVITTVTFGSSSSQSSTSMTAPSVSFGSSFQFGSSTSATTVTSASMSAASGAKSSQFAFGNATSSVFSAKPSGTASAGNNVSALSSTFETTGTETQTAASAVANGSIFGLQASSSAVPVSTSLPSFSSQSTLSAPSHAFGLNAPTSFNASTSVFGLSSTVANPFTSGSTSALNASGSSSASEPVSSSSNTSSIFGWQSSKATAPGSIFGTSFQSTGFSVGSTASGHSAAGNSTPIVFGATSSSSAASNSSPFVFGSGPPASSVFSVSSSAPSSTPFPSQPAFGYSTPQTFTFGSAPAAGYNDRMSMEDSMAEDSVQVSTPAAPVFGVPNSAPSSGFAFGAAAPSAGNPFQFGGQPNQIVPQNTPFQPSGSLEFNAGGGGGAGSFSLGSGGGDKANRRFVKVKKGVRRK